MTRAVAAGADPLAVSTAYGDHGAEVFRVARRVCGDEAAEEITQEVFVQLWRHPERYDPMRGSLRALLVTIAHHKAVDFVRGEERRRAREMRNYVSTVEAPPRDLDAGVITHQSLDSITAAVSRLPARERDALEATLFAGHSYREAAVLLGQPEGTTKSRIRSGLRRLRVALAEDSDGAAAASRRPAGPL